MAGAGLIMFYAFSKAGRNRRENNRQRFRDRQGEIIEILRRKRESPGDKINDSESV
jgi:hypothetical protein